MRRTLAAALALTVSGFAVAQDEAVDVLAKPWSAEVGLGIMLTSGNTDTRSINGLAEVIYEHAQWRHTGRAEALNSSADDIGTAERYAITGKSDYKLDDWNYLYGLIGYEDDRFSGYDYQSNIGVGYGRDLVRTDRLHVNAEAGVGARNYRVEGGDSDTEGTIRLAGALNWNISESALFTQELDTTIGEEMTVTNSITSLSTQVVGNLAAKLSVHVRHISDVPPGVEKRDTKTTANLVYKF